MRPHTAEHRRKVSLGVTRLWQDPTYRARQTIERQNRWTQERRDQAASRARVQRLGLERQRCEDIFAWFGGYPSERDYVLLSRYGLTEADYEMMFRQQSGRCAICQKESERRRLCVDHDHESGVVRGLLCDRCNRRVVGLIESQTGRVALEYLYGRRVLR